MKRIVIADHEFGLVLKNKALIEVLEQGSYWFWDNKLVEIGSKLMAVESIHLPMEVLLEHPLLKGKLELVNVKEGELGIIFENGLLKFVLQPGRYGFWKGVMDRKVIVADTTCVDIDSTISKAVLEKPALRPYVRKLTVPNEHQGVLFVDGKYRELLEPGAYFYWQNESSIEVKAVDIRMQQVEVSGQELLTKDKAGLRINFYLRYAVRDILLAVRENKDFDKQLYVMAQLALRAFIGNLTLDELLHKRSAIGQEIYQTLAENVKQLGVEVLDAGIRDVILPGEMRDIINKVLIAEKTAQANIIMRREETASTRSMLNTAKLMEENAMLRRLKEMEYVERIAEKVGAISLSGNSDIVGQLKSIFIQP